MRNYSKSKSIRSESSLCLRLEGVPSSELSLSDTPVAVVDRPVPELKPGLLSEPEVVVLVVEGDPEKDWLDRRVEPPSSKINYHSKNIFQKFVLKERFLWPLVQWLWITVSISFGPNFKADWSMLDWKENGNKQILGVCSSWTYIQRS